MLAPNLYKSLINSSILILFPGIGEEEKIIKSLCLILICGCLPSAILARPANASPWEPVVKINNSLSSYFDTCFLSIKIESSTSMYPNCLAILIPLTIERPKATTFLFISWAILIIALILDIFEAKAVMIIFLGACSIYSRIAFKISFSLGEW